MIRGVVIDEEGYAMTIMDIACPECKYPYGLAMRPGAVPLGEEPLLGKVFLAWCPCGTIWTYLRVLALAEVECQQRPDWWKERRK